MLYGSEGGVLSVTSELEEQVPESNEVVVVGLYGSVWECMGLCLMGLCRMGLSM